MPISGSEWTLEQTFPVGGDWGDDYRLQSAACVLGNGVLVIAEHAQATGETPPWEIVTASEYKDNVRIFQLDDNASISSPWQFRSSFTPSRGLYFRLRLKIARNDAHENVLVASCDEIETHPRGCPGAPRGGDSVLIVTDLLKSTTESASSSSNISEQVIFPSKDSGPRYWFGHYVDMDGNYLIVGDHCYHQKCFAHIYEFQSLNGTWSLHSTIEGPEGLDEFGKCVAIDNQSHTAVVGSYGKALVYTLDNDNNTWKLQKTIEVEGRGLKVAIDGDTLVIAAPDSGEMTAVHVYVRSGSEGSSWVKQAQLTPGTPMQENSEEHFGEVLSLDCDTLVVGSELSKYKDVRYAGAVYVFERTEGEWTKTAVLHGPNPTAFGRFGRYVDVRGNRIAVGMEALGACTDKEFKVYTYRCNKAEAVLLPYPNPKQTDCDDESVSQYFEDMTEHPSHAVDTGVEFAQWPPDSDPQSTPLLAEANRNSNHESVNSSIINNREYTASVHTSNRRLDADDAEEAGTRNRVATAAADNQAPQSPSSTASNPDNNRGGGKKRRHKSTIFLCAGISSLVLCVEFSLMAVFFGRANKNNKSTSPKQLVDPTNSSLYIGFPILSPQEQAPTQAPTPAPTKTPKFPGWLQDDTDSTASSTGGNATSDPATTTPPGEDVPTGEIVKVAIRSFGLLYDIEGSEVPSDQDYYGAANVMLSFLDSYLLEKYPGTNNKQGQELPYASYSSSSLYPPRESFAYSLNSGAMHDLRGNLSFLKPTAPGQSVPTPEELNQALEEAFRGDSAVQLLASELPAGNVFSTTTSTKKVEPAIPDPLPPEEDPTSAPTLMTTTTTPTTRPTTTPVLPIEVVEVTILPFELLYDLDRSDVPSLEDYEGAANVIFSFLDAYLLELYPGTEGGEDNQSYAQYNSSNLFMGSSAYSLLSGALHNVHGTVSFLEPTEPKQMVPTPEELNQALEAAFTGDQLMAAVDLLASELPPENLFSTTTSIRKTEAIEPEPLSSEDDSTSAPTVTNVALPTEVVTVLPFGLLYGMGVTDIPSDEDYEDAANVIFSFLDAYLLELYPGTEEDEDDQPYAQYNSSNLVMGLTAFSLLSGAVHDVHGTLSFVQPTGPGQMVPTPEELNQALEDAFTGDQSTVDFLASELPPENLFSMTTSMRKIESSEPNA